MSETGGEEKNGIPSFFDVPDAVFTADLIEDQALHNQQKVARNEESSSQSPRQSSREKSRPGKEPMGSTNV